jgi:quercetin dioxygenase-like cupin family protein
MSFINFDEVKESEIWEGITARLFHSDNLTFGKVKIENGAILPEHSHHNEQFTKVLEGRLEFKIGDETKVLESGMVAHVPPDVPHSAKALTACIVFDCFYPFREDFKRLVE